jgi:hypothetical protein
MSLIGLLLNYKKRLMGCLLEELKFNQHCNTFVLFDKKFPILD